MSGGPECTMDGHGPGGTERSPAMDAAIHELVFVVGASASAEEGVAVAAGRAASEPTSEDGSWEVPVEAAAETPSARSSGPAGGDVSREAEERPSSGPSSIAPSGGLEVDAPPKADLPPELVLEALDCSDEMLWGEADFDEVAGITLADVYSLREARGGTGARDLTRRAQQERRRARDVGQASPKLKPGRVLARHSERVAKAQRAARDRTDYMYRVEERRFKRRYRDWCCFGEAPRESRTRVRAAAWPVFPALAGPTARLAVRPAAEIAAQAPAAELVPIAEAAALPVAAVQGPTEAVTVRAIKKPTARSTMESYARMAYWRTVDLLQRSFGREHPVDASGRRQAAEVLYRRLLKSRLASAPPSPRLGWMARPGLRSLRRDLRFPRCWDLSYELSVGRKARGGRRLKRQARGRAFKLWLRSAGRKQSPAAAHAAEDATRLRQREMRREASRARTRCRAAEWDAKYLGLEPGHPAPPPTLSERSRARSRPANGHARPERRPSAVPASGKPPAEGRWAAGLARPARPPLAERCSEGSPAESTWPEVSTLPAQRAVAACSLRGPRPPRGARGGQQPRRRRRGKRSACQEQTGPRDGSDAESPKTTGVEPTSPCACEDPASEAPKDVAEVEGPGGADDLRDLISVWPSLDRFRRADAPRTDGKLLVPALRSSKPPTVATEEVFLERFHGRTRGIFRDLDWSNLRVIGGMMLACLVADDEDFRTSFAETDVDIYMVGLRGPEFQQRVASVMKDLYRAARSRDLKAVILRTPCTITLSLCGPRGEALPNVQVVMAPFESTRHLLSTTDIDCTGFGFDGDSLFATSLACEAIARRRLIARPEKYSIRGEFSTESRLLKYAMRGFDVVDLGLPPDLEVPEHEAIRSIASEASAALAAKALGEGEGGLSLDDTAMRFERALRATGVTGAHLLLLAARNPGLQELLLFDVPLLPAGLADEGLLGMLQACDASRRQDGYEHPRGKAKGRLPRGSQPSKLRVLFTSRTLGPIEEAVLDAVEERDPDGTSEARSWYTGLEAEHLIWEAAC
uniref:Uncharacterized protein n=1 Tax=Alexandrium monilatum TaxID=311494 RepID=A0A7S4QSQ9_9DINO